jgi:type I restriction enzyme S subunit
MTDTMRRLPTAWVQAAVDEIAIVLQGQSPPGTTYNAEGVGLPFLQGSAEFGDRNPTPIKWCSEPVRTAEPGDILISIRAPVGPTNIADQTYCIGRGLAAIRVLKSVEVGFLLHQLRHTVATLLDQSTGTTFDAIGGAVLREHVLAIAPVGEQERIVDAIESYLSRLDAAVASLERAKAKLKAYRASVLNAAVEGRLVPMEADLARREGQPYESAEVLLARILKERRRRWEKAELARMKAAGRTPKHDKWRTKYYEPVSPDSSKLPALPEGWRWARLDQVSELQLGQQRSPVHAASAVQIPYVRAANVTWDGLDLTDVKRMGFPNPARYRLLHGDVLLSEASGSPMEAGKPAIWRDEIQGACYQKTLIRVRAIDRQALLPEYLRLVFLRDCVTGKFARLAPGVGIVHLTAERMLPWPIPLPPISEQHRIVDEVDRLESIHKSIRASASQETMRIERLGQAVLKWAFEGKLANQDASDEPAEKLLARIRAERTATAPAKKTRARRVRAAS